MVKSKGMGHRVTFDHSFNRIRHLVSDQEVRDVIDMFYRFGDTNFFMTCNIPGAKPLLAGQHSYDGIQRIHQIYLSPDQIAVRFKGQGRLGGNTSAPTLKMAVVMVLVHELQHANQVVIHGGNCEIRRRIPFQSYVSRPIERDARSYVDNNLEQIAAFCEIKLDPKMKAKVVDVDSEKLEDELEDLADVLSEIDEIEVRDLNQELRSSGLTANSKNVTALRELLKERGVRVVS